MDVRHSAQRPIERYRESLLARKQYLAAVLAAPAEASTGVSEEDQPQAYQHEAVSSELNWMGYGQLRLIQEALDRLNSGDYGTCLACDGPIPARRLHAVPWARYCVPCQERADRERYTGSPAWQSPQAGMDQ